MRIRILLYSALPAFLALVLLPASAQALNIFIQNNYGAAEQGQRLVSSVPYDGEKLDQPPKAIVMTFTSGIKADKSTIRVFNMYNMQVNDGTVRGENNVMTADLPDLPPGAYHVRWSERCQCTGGDLSDTLRFTVR